MNKKKLQSISTPSYVIDLEKFNKNIECIKRAFLDQWGMNVKFGYSVKTNHLPFLLKHSKYRGFLAEVVSGDEYKFAISQGYEPYEIIYNGPNKDEITLLQAINGGTIVNVDNFNDIDIIKKNILIINKNNIKIGLRVNFDLESVCIGETTSGEEVSRFGFCVENGDFERALKELSGLGIVVSGLHMHYSTKTRSVKVFEQLSRKASELILLYGLNESVRFIDIGGGFFGGKVLSNKPTMNDYSEIITTELKKVLLPERVTLILEPGASIIATCIDYYCKVINIRTIRGTTIITVDGSVLHINPFMINRQSEFDDNTTLKKKVGKQIVCGNTCIENDRFIYLNNYNQFQVEDIIKFKNAGAYTMCYNNFFINYPPNVYAFDGEKCNILRGKLTGLMEKI